MERVSAASTNLLVGSEICSAMSVSETVTSELKVISTVTVLFLARFCSAVYCYPDA